CSATGGRRPGSTSSMPTWPRASGFRAGIWNACSTSARGSSGSRDDRLISGSFSRLKRATPAARLAIAAFCHRARKYLGVYLVVRGGGDAIVFGGGIGEHAPAIRARIAGGLEGLGIALDATSNSAATAGNAIISSPASRVELRVVAVDEAHIIARRTVEC